MTEDQIKHMTNRFLGWRLPMETWNPDNGISYKRPSYHPSVDATPVGTNLFSYAEAEGMVRHMLEGLGMTKVSICDLINAEIEWCRNDPENKNIQEDFRIGFIEGLTQAKRLVRVAYGIDEWLNLD